MLRVFYMELRRMLKMKSLYVTSLITTAIIALEIIMIAANDSKTYYRDIIYAMFSAPIFLVISSIFVILFVTYEYTNGYIKNFIGQIKDRTYVVISEYILGTIYSVINICWIVLVSYVLGKIILGENFVNGTPDYFGKYMIYTILICVGLNALFMFFATFFRSNVGPMVGMFLVTNSIGSLVAELFNMGIDKLFDKKPHLDNYLLSTYIGGMNFDVMMSNEIQNNESLSFEGFCIVGVVYLVLFFALSCMAIRKRDII